jgi:competence protein ComFC
VIRALIQPLARVASVGWDVLFPPACASCGRSSLSAGPGANCERLCPTCINELAPQVANRCSRCSAPVGPHLDTTEGCILCHDEKWGFDRAISLGVYDGSLRSAVLRMKQRGGEPLAAGLVELLVQKEHAAFSQARFDAVIPVPHHWWGRLRHTHLPPVTIARFLAARLNAPVVHDVVAKIKHTRPQAELTETERRRNLTGAFEPSGRPKLDGLSLLVVDDVMTTGQTVHRVSVALRKAGAKSITVAVIARTV